MALYGKMPAQPNPQMPVNNGAAGGMFGGTGGGNMFGQHQQQQQQQQMGGGLHGLGKSIAVDFLHVFRFVLIILYYLGGLSGFGLSATTSSVPSVQQQQPFGVNPQSNPFLGTGSSNRNTGGGGLGGLGGMGMQQQPQHNQVTIRKPFQNVTQVASSHAKSFFHHRCRINSAV